MPTRKNVDSITRTNSFSSTPISEEGLKSLTLKPRFKKSSYRKLTSSFLIFAMLFQIIGGVFLSVPKGNEVKADASISWYDSSWLHRKAITINGSTAGAQTNYQVSIPVTYNSNMKADFSDIRFTDSDGATLLGYWMESKTDSASASFWVKVPNIPVSPSTSTIYMYYGNGSALNASDGLKTFGMYGFEDFEAYNVGSLSGQTPSNAQDSWSNYVGNPIATGGRTWASVIKDNVGYKMYYSMASGLAYIGLMTSSDGKSWTDYGAVMNKGAAGSWDVAVWCPTVWKENGTYYMMYAGAASSVTQGGLATSTDGITWTKNIANPVFNSPDAWSHNHSEVFGVIKVGNTYNLYFNNYGSGDPRATGVATSTDLVHWATYQDTPIFTDGRFTGSPFKYGNYYYFLTSHYTSSSNYAQIELYRSSDPYFLPQNRELVRAAAINYGTSGQWNGHDQDSPYVLTDNIFRDSYHATNDELWTYFAGENEGVWGTGLSVETDMESALRKNDDPFVWGTSGNVNVVNTIYKSGTKSLGQQLPNSLTSLFASYRANGVIGSWMRRTTANTGDYDMYIYNGTNNLVAAIGLGRNGYFHYWNGTYHDTAVTFLANEWYFNTVEFKATTGKFNFVAYNKDLVEIERVNDISFASSTNQIGKFTFYNSSGFAGYGYADNIYIRNYTSPEPTFNAFGSEESSDHLTITGAATQTAGIAQTITLTAKTNLGNTYAPYTGDRILTLSGPTTIGSNVPTFTDKDGHEINFGSSGTIHFTNGVATTDIRLYKAEDTEIDATDGTYSTIGDASYDLNVSVSPNVINSFNIISPSSITSETPFSLSLTSKDAYRNTTTNITNPTILSVNYGKIDTASISNTEFQDGSYTDNITISEVYTDKNIVLTIENGSTTQFVNLSVTGVPHGVGFIPFAKPSLANVNITTDNGNLTFDNLPTIITQIVISTSPDFTDSSWEDISQKDTLLNRYPNNNTLYIKFRTQEGGVSDTITYTKDSDTTQTNTNPTLQDGDLAKTPNNPDVYIIKYKNNKQYKRLLLSPTIFNSYLHLKWDNIKTISQQQLDQYQTSNLVKETTDTIIYQLFPDNDTGKRKPLNPSTSYDPDSIYEINKPERDSYELED